MLSADGNAAGGGEYSGKRGLRQPGQGRQARAVGQGQNQDFECRQFSREEAFRSVRNS